MKIKQHILLLVGTAWMIDALDVALLSFIMPLLKKEWHLQATELGLVGSITSIGMIVGAILCGKLADIYGRKKIMLWTLLIFSLSNLMLSFSPNFTWFMIIRFITGVGLGGELPVAATLLADKYKGKKRDQILVLGDSFWAYGWILASLIAFLIIPVFGWRIAVAVSSFFALYSLVLRRHLPEDQTMQSDYKRTFKILVSKPYRINLIVLSLIWFIIMLTYYGLFLWLPSILVLRGFSIVDSLSFTLMMSVAQLPGYYLAAYMMNKINRKIILVIYLVGTVISFLLFGMASHVLVVLIAGALMSFFDLGAWGVLIAISPSQFPTEIRGTGMGTAQSVGRVGATLGPFLVGKMIDMKLGISIVLSLFVILLLIVIIALLFILKENSPFERNSVFPLNGE